MRLPKLTLTLLATVGSTPASAEGRYQAIFANAERTILFDDMSLQRRGNATFWTVSIERDSDYDYMLVKQEVDCSDRMWRPTFFLQYENTSVSRSGPLTSEFTPIAPSSTGEITANYACDGELSEGYETFRVPSDMLHRMKGILFTKDAE